MNATHSRDRTVTHFRLPASAWLSLLLVLVGHAVVLAWIWSHQAEALMAVSDAQTVLVTLQPPAAPVPPAPADQPASAAPRRASKPAPPRPASRPANDPALVAAPDPALSAEPPGRQEQVPAAEGSPAAPTELAAPASGPAEGLVREAGKSALPAPPAGPDPTAGPARDAAEAAAVEVAPLAGLSDGLYAQPLAPFVSRQQLSFDVHVPKDYQESSASGTAQVLFESGRDDSGRDTYRIDIDIRPNFGLRLFVGGNLRYQSHGLVGRNGPQTLRYSEKVGNRAERWLEIERPRREMKSVQIASLMLPPGAQDRLSVIGLLSMLARSDPALLDKGKVFSVPMFTFRQHYMARFESYGPAVLESPAGVLQTLHVGYRSGAPDSDKVDLWLGYDLQMQPVRIRWQEAQGRVIDLILQKKP